MLSTQDGIDLKQAHRFLYTGSKNPPSQYKGGCRYPGCCQICPSHSLPVRKLRILELHNTGGWDHPETQFVEKQTKRNVGSQ